METAQRVVRRNGLFSRLVLVLVGASVLLLCYSVLRENLPDRLTVNWPWKLRLLDIQSATTATIATVGASLARAQYARAIRPALGYFGRAMAELAPGERLAWGCHMINGAQDVAIVQEMSYQVRFTESASQENSRNGTEWVDVHTAAATIESRGLEHREDFRLDFVGPGRPLPAQGLMLLSWFTERAMREVESVFVRVRVVDRVGDTHERCINLLKGANRTPRHPDAPPF
ncbi:hypothetical protein [Streptomyces sp. NBC_00236]|uniref:hypothetical protein n=1 Tax=Streptomyces sp. NBC_00236 TaxID=2903639 RepID=UPI002E2BA820|nr:hypothetical protein [Streptomyces sp. NBC_00236]